MTKINVEILLVLLVATICVFSKTAIEVQDVHKIDQLWLVVVVVVVVVVDHLRLWLVFPSSQSMGFEPNICWGLHQGILR